MEFGDQRLNDLIIKGGDNEEKLLQLYS